jgi:phosphoglycolate phosphatase-like HAD superfamily hydrolase
MQLVLWDIDGTLVDTAGHGATAFADAFEAVFGRPPEGLVPMAGRTDHEIALAILERSEVEGGESHLPDMWRELELALNGRREAIEADGRALPGVEAVLEELSRCDDVLQSLLTGNIAANAATKLGAFGLDRLLDLEIGGYGSDGGVRSELVRVALDRARERRGVDLTPADVVLVGDTPLDVAAGHAAGVRVVAVASGYSSEADLREAGPEVVLEDLRDTTAAVEAILAA